MARRHVAALGLAALVVGACSDDGDPPERPPTRDYGLAGSSCGEVVVALGSGGELPQWSVDCMLAALDERREAHLVVTQTTVEGDPVFTAYQGTGKGEVVRIDDPRWDQFGADAISRQLCSSSTSGGRHQLTGDGGRSLFLTDCRELPDPLAK